MKTTLQEVLAISGFLVAILAVIASVDIFMTDRPYMHDIIDIGYYGRHIITILGGLGVGFLFARLSLKRQNKKDRQRFPLWLTSVSFGLLTLSVYYLLDYLRIPVREIFGDLPFPWSKLLFMGLPFIALALVALVACIAFLRKKTVSAFEGWFQQMFAGAFIAGQVMMILLGGFIFSYAYYSISITTLCISLLVLLAIPLTVAATAYIAFGKMKDRTFRLFIATTVGVSYQAAVSMSWEFRTDPQYQATLIFHIVVTMIAYAAAMALIVIVRRLVRRDTRK